MDIWSLSFWKRLVENDIHAFSGGMLGVIAAEQAHVITQVPWSSAFQVGAMGALISTLVTLGAQQIPNTPPGSFIPPKDSEGP
jgi:hypothetical protein